MVVRFSVSIVVEPDEDGFHAFCPALKGLHVGGRTEQEALKNAADGALLYLKSLVRQGDPIPVGVTVERVSNGRSNTHLAVALHMLAYHRLST